MLVTASVKLRHAARTSASLTRLQLVIHHHTFDTRRTTMVRKGVWIAAIIGSWPPCGFGLQGPCRRRHRCRQAPTAPNFTLPSQEDTARQLSQTTRASGSSSTSTPRTDHRLHHRGAQLPARPAQVRRAERRRPRRLARHRREPQDLVHQGLASPSSCSPIPTTRSSTRTACPSSTHGDMQVRAARHLPHLARRARS